ncbi:hypothetical protein BO71DRAFT_331387 [Aspergillus ellipticus CBS 707.79]|uniref:BZIP domain-containing protein n=1 Tax=Aspergillus ellipticus CBS 707.79 TaxID=1448320 RepID=A0A319D300_9EURO|nr:hypothetical protein BO71DRAFT_331387 [Aspergillus ellipticus CBS 707.79]
MDPDTALVPWESINEHFFGSQYTPSDSATPQITSLLSACSYPMPQQLRQPQGKPRHSQPQLLGGLVVNNPPYENGRNMQASQPPQPQQPATKLPKRPRSDVPPPAGSSANKRGRPRKIVEGPMAEDPEERRRRQIRLAQRAYRSRKEASVSLLKTRISELETVVEKMSTAVLSFSDELVHSGMLASNAIMAEHLRDTVQTCLTLAREASKDSDQESATVSPPQTQETSPFLGHESHGQTPPLVELEDSLPSSFESNVHLNFGGLHEMHQGSSMQFFEPLENSEMDLTVFADKLHMACVRQGCLALNDDSISLERLQKHFYLTLQIMDRKSIAAYFQMALSTKQSRKNLEQGGVVPFFSLGGAGTHYPRSLLKSRTANSTFPPRVHWVSPQSLASLPQIIQELFQGEWFEMSDLEEYIREKNVHLLTYAPMNFAQQHSSSGVAVDAARLIQTLTAKAICLGWTPGFRRGDVEDAVRSCLWT